MTIELPFVTREVLMTLKSILLRLCILTTHVHVGCAGSDAQGESGEEVTKEQYDRWMTELSNWGRWGDDETRGLTRCDRWLPVERGARLVCQVDQ